MADDEHDSAQPAVSGPPLLETVLRLSRLQAAEPPLQDFLDETVAAVHQITKIEHVKVLCYRPLQGDLLVIAGVGWNEGVVGNAVLPIDIASPPGRVIQTGRSSVVEDITTEGDFRLSPLLRSHNIRSLINVPIIVENAVWGVLEADSEQPRQFSEELSMFLETMACMIGAAVRTNRRRTAADEYRTEAMREAAHREMLLTEMHHRVKNNFQVIVSSLLIQRRRTRTEETRQVLQTMANRVMAISLAHDQLDPRQESQRVAIPTYLGALCRMIGQIAEGVSIETDFDEGDLPIEDAVALGLILNELLTNALKYAFDGTGRVDVTFRAGLAEREGCLSVADDGKGMTEPDRKGSSGTTLVEALATQLHGRIDREHPERGTIVRVYFTMR